MRVSVARAEQSVGSAFILCPRGGDAVLTPAWLSACHTREVEKARVPLTGLPLAARGPLGLHPVGSSSPQRLQSNPPVPPGVAQQADKSGTEQHHGAGFRVGKGGIRDGS